MRRLTLSHLASTVWEDDLLVLIQKSRSMCKRRGVTSEIFIHQCWIPHWILERILCLKVTRKRIVEVLHVTYDIQRHIRTILLNIQQFLDLLIQALVVPSMFVVLFILHHFILLMLGLQEVSQILPVQLVHEIVVFWFDR